MPAIPLRVYAYIAIAVAIGLFCWWLYDKGGDNREAALVAQHEKDMAAERAKTASAEATARQITEDKDRAFLTTTTNLQFRIDELVGRPERVRIVTRCAGETTISSPATESNAATAGNGSDMRTGHDPTDELVRYAGRCEADRIKVIALQDWILAQRQAWLASLDMPAQNNLETSRRSLSATLEESRLSYIP